MKDRMVLSFERVWEDILDYARSLEEVETLARKKTNEIVNVFDASITVRSKETRKKRILSKKDFQYAWNRLLSKKAIVLQDIDPELRGKKSIVFAFLEGLPYVKCEIEPLLKIFLAKNPQQNMEYFGQNSQSSSSRFTDMV